MDKKHIQLNGFAFVTQRLIDPMIYCPKWFDIINHVTFHWMCAAFVGLATLQFETKLQKCIRMGITIFKIFIWGGILSDIQSEITFTALLAHCSKTKFQTIPK